MTHSDQMFALGAAVAGLRSLPTARQWISLLRYGPLPRLTIPR